MESTIDITLVISYENVYGIIYIFISPTGGIYIGQTIKMLEGRAKEHVSDTTRGSNKKFHNAIRKHGIDNFKSSILAVAYSKEELNELEKHYIQKYNSFYKNEDGSDNKNGYNMTLGGEGANGYSFTEDDRIKLSNSLKEYYQKNPEKLEEMSKRQKEYAKNHPEKRAQHSQYMKERLQDEEIKSMTIKPLNDYYEANPNAYSELQTKRFENEDERKKASERSTRYFVEHPEALVEKSERAKEYAKNHPEKGEEHSERMKEISNTPERKETFQQIMKDDRENNPGKYEEANEKRIETMNRPEFKKAMSLIKTKPLSPFEIFDANTREKIGGIFTSVPECMDFLKENYGIEKAPSIQKCLDGKLKASGGYRFQYIKK